MRGLYSALVLNYCAFFPLWLNFHKVLGSFSGRSLLKCKVFWRDSAVFRG